MRGPQAALYDCHNDHYLVQRLGAGAAAAGMTSPTGASSEDQTQCLLGPLATHCAQLNSTDVSSKRKWSREYTHGNTTNLCILEQRKKRAVLTVECYSCGGDLWKVQCNYSSAICRKNDYKGQCNGTIHLSCGNMMFLCLNHTQKVATGTKTTEEEFEKARLLNPITCCVSVFIKHLRNGNES